MREKRSCRFEILWRRQSANINVESVIFAFFRRSGSAICSYPAGVRKCVWYVNGVLLARFAPPQETENSMKFILTRERRFPGNVMLAPLFCSPWLTLWKNQFSMTRVFVATSCRFKHFTLFTYPMQRKLAQSFVQDSKLIVCIRFGTHAKFVICTPLCIHVLGLNDVIVNGKHAPRIYGIGKIAYTTIRF